MRLLSNYAHQSLTNGISPTRVILIRHGRSSFNQLQLYQGSSDASLLTEQGCQTAQQVGQFLAGESIDAIYTSPLQRAQQTANILLQSLSPCPPSLNIHYSLREIEMGNWEGRSFQEVQQTEAVAYQCWKQRPHEFRLEQPQAAHGAVSSGTAAVATRTHYYPVLDLYDRAQHFWQEILPRHRGQTIAIVSHGGTNRALISTAIGLAPAKFHSLQQSNCGLSVLQFSGSKVASGHLTTLNLTTPLGETLPKLKEGKRGLRLLLLPAETPVRSATAVADLLHEAAIEFSLTHISGSSQSLVQRILQSHPETIQLQSQQQHFLHAWQQTIAAKSDYSTQLMTGLVVAKSSEIQQLLGNAIGLNPKDHKRLQIQPGTLSVLHYPTADCLPIVQAINFSRNPF